jgi:DNA-binding transcriptional regulator YiaG
MICDFCYREHPVLTPEGVKALYSHVCKTGQFPNGAVDVRHIEQAIGKEIPSTAEFHRLVGEFLTKRSGTSLTPGQQLRRKRVFKGLRQLELARLLGVTKMAVSYYEKGTRPLSRQALEWLNGEIAATGAE